MMQMKRQTECTRCGRKDKMLIIETKDRGEIEVITYCDIIDRCEDCPRCGDDCDGKDED